MALCALLAPTPTRAQAARAAHASTGSSLHDRISALIDKSGLSADTNVALSIIDLASGRSVFAHRATVPQNPASNLKLLTTTAALLELGADYRMHTSLLGRVVDRRIMGGLCLKGQGDPTLTRADFAGFAQQLRDDEGVAEVDDVIIDGSYFDAQLLPPAFEQQPEESAAFRAAVAAVSVNANAYTLRLRAGAKLGEPALVTVDGASYFEIDNGLTTSASNVGPNVQVSERDLGERVALTLRGSIPQRATPVLVSRRVASPLRYAGQVFVDALAAAGIKTPAHARIAPCSADAPVLASHASAVLSQVLSRLGKDSDNFVAEMVLKTLGAERTHKPGTSADGVRVVTSALQRLKLPTKDLTMINGSGLFLGNRITTDLLSRVLLTVYRNPALRPDFVSELAVGGVDGTLVKRLRSLPAPRIVRAKTGTLDDVIALSGYVLGPSPERGYAFSYLANGITGKQPQARDLIDGIVSALAGQLYKDKVSTVAAQN